MADFGYARYLADEGRRMSDQCCTLWYRPPELLYGATEYGFGIDAWSAGCVLAEIGLRMPLFRGDSDSNQLAKIFQILGPPDESTWPGVTSLRKYVKFSQVPAPGLRRYLTDGQLPIDFIDLILPLLHCDPKTRASCADSLSSAYFQNPPRPVAKRPLRS